MAEQIEEKRKKKAEAEAKKDKWLITISLILYAL